jgi:signal transduction histidine kinase
MRLLPRTLYGQLLLSLCLGLIAAQAAGIWLTLNDRARFGEGLLGAFAAQRIAGVITILDQVEPFERARLVRSLNVPPTHVSLDESWQNSADQSDDAKSFVGHVQRDLDRPAEIQVISIKRAEIRRREDPGAPPGTERVRENGKDSAKDGPTPGNPETEPASASGPRPESGQTAASGTSDTAPTSATPANGPPGPNGPTDSQRRANRRLHMNPPVLLVVGQARLTDGTVVTFRHSLPQPGLDWPITLLGLLAIVGVSVALLSGLAVRRLTKPLASLAEAAGGLARNLDRPPLPETGPLEVSQAAKAFNSMQRELKLYLETRAQALAAVSHDLRMPITRLRLRLERLEEGELRTKMDGDLTEMDGMIGNTLEFLRAGSITEKASKVDLDALIDSVVEDMTSVGATIRQSGAASVPVEARPLALRRCLTNLIDNARRYGGGHIDVSVTELSDRVEVNIEDRGPGIPEEDLERVFEPYVRVEISRARHTGGTGLGLAIARAIAKSHGGDVHLKNRAGGGISAILTLPVKASV